MKSTNQAYGVRVLINGSTPTTEYNHTDGNTYIEGRQNSKYQIEFNNYSSERIMVIPAIDGLSAINKTPAGYDSPGYVVNASQSVIIPGWRNTDSAANPFKFYDRESNHSLNSTGRMSDTGVMGFIVYKEEPQINPNPFPGNTPVLRTARNTPAATSSVNFQTKEVNFVKKVGGEPTILTIFYDTIQGLRNRGIQVETKRMVSNIPSAFPGAQKIEGLQAIGGKPINPFDRDNMH